MSSLDDPPAGQPRSDPAPPRSRESSPALHAPRGSSPSGFPVPRDSSPGLSRESSPSGSPRPRESSPGMPPPRRTMPPPELFDRPAPTSVGSLVLEQVRAGAPLSRHSGPRAEETWLRARLAEHAASGDMTAERHVAIALARLLGTRGTDLDTAITMARRALVIADDRGLRTELAGWLAGLGESVSAAETLRRLGTPEDPADFARTLVRVAVLLARANDVAGSADALHEAMTLDPNEGLACELYSTLSAWAPSVVTHEEAAMSYLEAAIRREAAEDRDGAFEDLLRAFEVAPDQEPVAAALAEALTAQDRTGAADEVLRAHARAQAAPEQARAAHRARVLGALAGSDPVCAVGAALDAGFEGEVGGDFDSKLNEALALAGLHELLAIRLELAAETRQGAARAAVLTELAHLCAGPLASPDRAVEAWIEAAASDPEDGGARAALRDHAVGLHDYTPLLEALIRIAERSETTEPASPNARAAIGAALRELVTLAEEKLSEPALAVWALERLASLDGASEETSATVQRLATRVRAQDEALAASHRVLDGAHREARVEALRRLAPLYRGRPRDRAAYHDVLTTLATAMPTDRAATSALERITLRTGDLGPLEAVMRARLTSSLPRVERVRARLALASVARRRGDEGRALEEVIPLLTEAPGHRGAASIALVLSTRGRRARERADALVQLSGPVSPAMRAMLLAVAAEIYHGADQVDDPGGHVEAAERPLAGLARRSAELACEADPTSARAIAVLATILGAHGDPAGAAAVERAMGVVVPRGELCDALARTLEAQGEIDLALAWTQRWLALRPGSLRAITELIRRAVAARDASRLSDALSWVLAQPQPIGELVEPFSEALHPLFDLAPAKAMAVARRALDIFGPRLPVLRTLLIELADRAEDPSLAIAVLERWLGSEPAEEQGTALLLELSSRRRHAGDFDGAARELARAAERGAAPEDLLARLRDLELEMGELEGDFSSDGQIAVAEARARALTAIGSAEAARAANAWRELGSLRWDLADDHAGGEAAFFAASEVSPNGGIQRYARDLCQFAGAPMTLDALARRASSLQGEDQRAARATVLIEAANLATLHGHAESALHTARAAIELDPSRTDAIALIEKNTHAEGGVAVLDETYELLATAAYGCYGRRAAHYRAARQLERRGAAEPALRHAIACFEAVPVEGSSFLLLTRLAARAADPSDAVRALERVAARGGDEARTMWLKRAAALTGRSEEGARMRFDILLRALHVRPDVGIVEDIGFALREVCALPGERDIAVMRFERAAKASLKKLGGPDGARAAVALARVALADCRAPSVAVTLLERAMTADGDIDEFMSLADRMPDLAADRDAASELLTMICSAIDRPYSSVGTALLRLGSTLARALGDQGLVASLLVEAARRAPDDDALVDAASMAVGEVHEETLRAALDEALPVVRRIEALLHLAEKHRREGDHARAIGVLERASALEGASVEDHTRVVTQLRQLLGAAGRTTDVEELLRRELERDLTPASRLRTARDLAALLAGRNEHQAALEVLADTTAEVPLDKDLLAEVQRLARRTGDQQRHVEVLTRLAAASSGGPSHLLVLRELAPLSRERGDRVSAMAQYDAILEIDPTDAEALAALEQDAGERGDYEAIAAILAHRISLAVSVETRRRLRLRRAAVLEQRLNRLDDAVHELETLLQEVQDDASALRFLADIHERLGAPLRAASLWQRAIELASAPDEKAEYGLRACTCFINGGNVAGARTMLEALDGIAPPESLIEPRIQIARHGGDMRALADALTELAALPHSPERRAEILLEAARAASAAGDDAGALSRASRALKLAPSSAGAALEMRRLQYRAGGAGTPREAQAAVDDLLRIKSGLTPAQVELHSFLLAEELDVIQGGGAGMRELSLRHAEIGPVPLVALGMAERMVRSKQFEAAVPLFESALAGSLQGMRDRGRVALAAAEAAVHAGEIDTAAQLLDLAAAEPETRTVAARRQLELAAAHGDFEASRDALEALSSRLTGIDLARVLAHIGRLHFESDPGKALTAYRDALLLATADRALHAALTEELRLLEESAVILDSPLSSDADFLAAEVESAEDIPPSAPPQVEPADDLEPDAAEADAPSEPVEDDETPPPEAVFEHAAPTVSEITPDPSAYATLRSPHIVRDAARAAVETPPTGSVLQRPNLGFSPPAPQVEVRESSDRIDAEPASLAAKSVRDPSSLRGARIQLADLPVPASFRPSVLDADEDALLDELVNAGDYSAGDRLIDSYGERAAERTRDVLAVRRQQASLLPGDRATLAKLHHAALADKNAVYAQAVEHVLRSFDPGAGPLPPPPLAGQREAPDLVSAFLFRIVASPVNEALAIAWESGLYRREPSQYNLTGLERVQPNATTVLGEVYGSVARLLGLVRVGLFHRRGTGALQSQFALLSPPAIMLIGDVREDSPDLRYALGSAMTGAMPEHILVNAQPEDDLRTLLAALVTAFGPVGATPRGDPAVARLAQDLWQMVPPRGARRLAEICAAPHTMSFESARDCSEHTMRRAGLFASGNLATAVRATVAQLGVPLNVPLTSREGLARACASHPAIADLVRLATRMEYAEARWRPASAAERRRSESGSRFGAGTS